MAGKTDQFLKLDDAGRPRLKYQRLKGLLAGELRSGRFKPGDPLPTVLELADQFEVSPTTVRRAMNELDGDGLIRRIRGKDTFVNESARDEQRRGLNMFTLVVPETQTALFTRFPQFHGAGRYQHPRRRARSIAGRPAFKRPLWPLARGPPCSEMQVTLLAHCGPESWQPKQL